MSIHRIVTLVGTAAALSACASSRQAADRADPALARAQAAGQAQWSATLAAQGGTTVSGTATVGPGSDASQTAASVTLAGADSGAVHPWHIHRGRCGDNGPIVGPASAYPPLTVGSDGTATATATLPFATPMSGSYYVNVHRSATEMGIIVSCGNLALGGA